MNSKFFEDWKRELPLELASIILIPASIFSFIRIFDTSNTVFFLIAVSLTSSVVAIISRRLSIPLNLSFIISTILLILIVTAKFSSESAYFGLVPSRDSIDVFIELLRDLNIQLKEQSAPIEMSTSFEFIGIIIAWLMAFLTDWAALRLKLAFEPALPTTLLFLFGSLPDFSSGNYGVISSLVFGSAIAIWAITQRNHRVSSQSLILTTKSGAISATGSLRIAGLVISLAAVLIGGLYANKPLVAKIEPAFEPNILGLKNQDRVVDNPYIDLEKRLVTQTDASLFTVQSKQRSYWRMVGMDTYENQNDLGQDISIWQVHIGGDDKIPTDLIQPKNSLGTPIEQSINIQSLDIPDITGRSEASPNVWIPAALAPTRILEDNGAKLTLDGITQTIIIDNDDESSTYAYTVLSQTPDYTATQLRSASQNLSQGSNKPELYVNLPDKPLPSVVRSTAEQIIGNETNRYDQMIALQSYFQEFDYSIDLDPIPPGRNAIEHFLQERIGFCQHFSGTFALMARELGIPARVAVGFTWGDEVSVADDGTVTYQVKGKHAHAWPEIWFGDELGWVPFEPTPGRGIPGGTGYTGLNANQDSDVSDSLEPEIEITDIETTTTEVEIEEVNPEEINPEETTTTTLKPIITQEYSKDKSLAEKLPVNPNTLPWKWIMLGLLLISYPVGMPLIHNLKRKRLWRKIDQLKESTELGATSTQVQLLWSQVCNILTLHKDIRRSSPETTSEFSARVGAITRLENQEVRFDNLADAVTKSYYNPQGVDQVEAALGEQEARELERIILEQSSKFDIWKKTLDPKRLRIPDGKSSKSKFKQILNSKI